MNIIKTLSQEYPTVRVPLVFSTGGQTPTVGTLTFSATGWQYAVDTGTIEDPLPGTIGLSAHDGFQSLSCNQMMDSSVAGYIRQAGELCVDESGFVHWEASGGALAGPRALLTSFNQPGVSGIKSGTFSLETTGSLSLTRPNTTTASLIIKSYFDESAADIPGTGNALYIHPSFAYSSSRVYFGRSGLTLYAVNWKYVTKFECFPSEISPDASKDFTIGMPWQRQLYLRHNPVYGLPNASFIWPAVTTDNMDVVGYFHFKSNCNDNKANQAYVLDTSVTRTVGSLLEVRNNGTAIFQVKRASSKTRLNIKDIPTASTGLASGDIWANNNVLTIVP